MSDRILVEVLSGYWSRVREGLFTTLDLLKDEELDIVIYPDGRSVRQIAMHIAQEELGEFAHGITQELDSFPAEFPPEDYRDVDSIKRLLTSIHDPLMYYLSQLADEDLQKTILTPWGAEFKLVEMLLHILEHEIHHRGELSLALGLLGRPGLDA